MDIDKRWIALAALILIIVFGAGVKYSDYKHNQKEPDELLIDSSPAIDETLAPEESVIKMIEVYVTGAVKYPGVYRLKEGDRMHHAVELAGGTVEEAEVRNLDMARLLMDGETIIVPFKGEEPEIITSSGISTSPAGYGQQSGLLNINTASAQEMADKLDGIGPSLGQRIVDYRSSNGMFKNIEDLKNVSGIGDKRFDAIKDKITVR